VATVNLRHRQPTITTHEGAPAKRVGSEAQLRRSVMACLLWESEFYEDGQSIAVRIQEGVAAVPLEVAASIAIEAREQMHLRHVPLLIVREMARRGGKIVGDTLARVIQRADELSEFLALYWQDGKTPLSAQVKRGLAEAFTKFDAYQLAKYDRARDVRLRDVLFLAHPKPTKPEHEALWKGLVDGTLPAPDTWEVALSGGADKLEAWTRLLTERKLGGLALLRNLRNMQEAKVPEPLIREAIADNRFSRVLPFRFIAAAKFAPTMEDALEAAMLRGLEEMPKLPGRTTLLVDHSGSMNEKLSAKSDLTRFDAACGLAILVREICEHAEIVAFSNYAALVPPRRGFALSDAIRQAGHFGGTYTEAAKQAVDARGYDRLVILTDEQSHQAISNPNGRGYVVNVASAKNGIGYGAWNHIDGWSEAVVRYIQASEAVPA
jgi:60 kDa SS-A/Ro ribonucleoprotein